MKRVVMVLGVIVAFALKAADAKPLAHDPLARLWDVENCSSNRCLMALDIGHGNHKDPEYLSIHVVVDKSKKKGG